MAPEPNATAATNAPTGKVNPVKASIAKPLNTAPPPANQVCVLSLLEHFPLPSLSSSSPDGAVIFVYTKSEGLSSEPKLNKKPTHPPLSAN